MEKVKLGDYIEVKTGKLDANASDKDGLYPFFTCSQIPLRINKFAFDCECILIAGNGDLNVKYYNGKFNAYQRTYIITANDSISPKYLYHFFQYYIEKLRAQSIGGVIKYIKLNNLTDILFNLYDLQTQQKIVEELDCLSDVIEKKKQQLADLDNLVKSKFDEMFNNKDFPNKHLKDICTKITDGSHNPPQGINFSEYPMLSSQNINGGIFFDNVRYLTQEDFERENKRTNVQSGDILITIVGTIGRSAIINNEKITLQRSVAVLKPNEEINSYYLNELLKSSKTQVQLNNKAHGASQKGVYLADLKTLSIIVPQIELQNKFAEFVKHIDELKLELNQSIEETQNLFNERMQHYFGD